MYTIKLHYGPYEAHGVIRHKTQRLYGTVEYLKVLGYEVELVPSPHINRLTVEMMGVQVFRCNIKNLLFNIDYDDDPVCRRLVNAVEEARTRLYTPSNMPKFPPVSEGKRVLLKQAKNVQYSDE